MSRLTVFNTSNTPEASLPFLEKVQAANGFIPNLIGVLANAPQALETYLTVSGINAQSSLNPTEREVVQLTAARIHGCGFCVAGHSATVIKKHLFSREDTLAIQHGEPLSDPRLQTLASFTTEVIATRGAVSDAALNDLLQAGFSQQQALEVVLGVSLATLCNFANNLAQTELNPQLKPFAIGQLSSQS